MSDQPTVARSHFGKALRRARKERGLSQTALAHLAGTDQAGISHYETGRWIPTKATLSRLRTVLPELPEPTATRTPQRVTGPMLRTAAQVDAMPPDARLVYLTRISRGWTLLRVAEQIGVDLSYLSMVEGGKRRLSDALRKRLEGVLL